MDLSQAARRHYASDETGRLMQAIDAMREALRQLTTQAGQTGTATRTLAEVADVVRKAARRISGADGVAFVLRDNEQCWYFDEDAIGPLWKGKRFPLTACISGWAMLNRQTVIIPDIYLDDRIPHDAYRPTFVKSLVMVPIRQTDPVGAIGTYWAKNRLPSEEELSILQALDQAGAIDGELQVI